MKFFKNKFFIITLSIAVFSTILIATLSAMGQNPLSSALNGISMPFRYVGVKIKESFDGFSRYFESMDGLIKENEELKDEIESLEQALAENEIAEHENAVLRDYLDIKKSYPSFEMVDALIIGKDSGNYMTVLTLNRGEGDGVKAGMPVIVPSGLVGSVSEVGYDWCRVRIIIEASASVGAYIPRSGETCILSGDISLKGTNTCILEYLSENSDVEVGDIVYTRGEDSNYPRDIYIGRVTSVRVNEYLRTKEAVVESAVDFQSLKYVLIVTDYEITEKETYSGE